MKIQVDKTLSGNVISSSSSLSSEMSDHFYSPLPSHLSLWQTLVGRCLSILQQLIFRQFYILCFPHEKNTRTKPTLTVKKIGDKKVEVFAHGCTGALWIRHFSVAPEQYRKLPFPWAINTKAVANTHESNPGAVLLLLPAAPPPAARGANCSLSESWHLSPSAFAVQWRTWAAPELPNSPLPLTHNHLWIIICANVCTLFPFWQSSEKVSVLLQPSSNCLLNNPSLHPTDCFLWRETNILTNTADDIWNYKRVCWVN